MAQAELQLPVRAGAVRAKSKAPTLAARTPLPLQRLASQPR
jgi:hypothetical protein